MARPVLARPSYASGIATPETGGLARPDLWRGVVGAWAPMLGATGLTLRDHSGHANHGTLTNFTLSDAWADPSAMTFDGSNDYVDCGDIDSLDGVSQFTWSVWFNPVAWANNDFVMEKGSVFALCQHSSIVGTNGGFTVSDGAWKPVDFAAAPTLGEWTHVVATLSGATLSLYVDGVFVTSRADIGTVASRVDVFNIGGRSTTFPFNGKIDDVILYSRALPATEIAELYRLGPGGIYRRQQSFLTSAASPAAAVTSSTGVIRIKSEARPSYSQGLATPETGGLAYPDLWRGVVGAWAPSLGATGLTLRDHSGHANHGTLTNFTLSDGWADPSGLTFDGTADYVLGPDAAVLEPASLGLDIWFKPADTGVANQVLIQKIHATASAGYMVQWRDNGAASLIRVFLGQGSGPGYVQLSSTTTFTVGEWYQISVSAPAGGTARLYINGKEEDSAAFASFDYVDAGALSIGRDSRSGGSQWLNGALDSVSIWDRALPASAVADLHRLGPGGIYRRQQFTPVVSTEAAAATGRINSLVGVGGGMIGYGGGMIGRGY